MRIFPYAVKAVAVATIFIELGVSNAQVCIDHGFLIEFEGECNYENVLAAFTDQVYSATGATSCTVTLADAKTALDSKLAAANMDINDLCALVYDSTPKTPFTDAANKGDDLEFEKHFYNGRTVWQEEVETLYETDDGTATSILKEDAIAVRAFYEGLAQGTPVEWPGSLTNFQSSVVDDNGQPTCETNAAMCCWPKDRQAKDNNGNCATPYDVNCVDKDPADNTDLCFVDMSVGNESNEFGSDGTVLYEGDGNNNNNLGEGPIHCHGLAWSNDVTDATARYKANNLFFVSMYDHMYQRGYVRNIPGAPMCACVEKMPTVSRSDCTQVDLVETIRIAYDSDLTSFSGSVIAIDVNFNACRGVNNRNNDLWAYMARLYYQGDITPAQFGQAGRIITDKGCETAIQYELNTKGLTYGHVHDSASWSAVASRGALDVTDGYGKIGFNLSMKYSTSSPYGIFYRACATCYPDHKKIYYRRLTPIPDDFDLMHNLLFKNVQEVGNIWNTDFSLHSTYEDAVSGTKAWLCPNGIYNYGASFPGECSPDGTRVTNQASLFNWMSNIDVGFYVNKPEADAKLRVVSTNIIQPTSYSPPWAGGVTLKTADGTIIMTGSGRDIWNQEDEFNYYAQPATGDVTVVVKASKISWVNSNSWIKAGIMIRKSMSPSSAHISLFLTAGNGVCPMWRAGNPSNLWSEWPGSCVAGTIGATSAWLKIEKRINTFRLYSGVDSSVPGVVTWTFIRSVELPLIGNSYNVGLAVTSKSNYNAEAIFEKYQTDQYFFPSIAPSRSEAPTAFVPSQDIGLVGIVGSASKSSTGHWTVKGSGADIWGGSDQFRFVKFNSTAANVTVSIFVESFAGINPWAKGGLMIRESLEIGSSHFSAYVSGSAGLANQWRPCKNCGSSHFGVGSGTYSNVQLRITKTGNLFQAFFKQVGSTTWSTLGNTVSIPFTSAQFFVGIAVTSHDNSKLATLKANQLTIV